MSSSSAPSFAATQSANMVGTTNAVNAANAAKQAAAKMHRRSRTGKSCSLASVQGSPLFAQANTTAQVASHAD